jgi:iron complex transport system ATP-binding protein
MSTAATIEQTARALEAGDLRAGYGRKRVLDGITLPRMNPGEITALVGPNAAGKTTLLRVLARLLPASGRIVLGTDDLLHVGRVQHAATVTYMPQALPQQVALTVFESVMSALMSTPDSLPGGKTEAMRRTGAVLERLEIADLAMTSLDQMSGGQRQLASLAQAVVREPRILLLDEPTSALDMHHSHNVMRLTRDLARERGMIVVMVLHDLTLACRWADRIILMCDGAVVTSGTPQAAITPQTLGAVYQVKARVERCSNGFLQVMVDDTLPGRMS